MVKVIRHKSLTVDGLRERLKTAMSKPQERTCPTCNGHGHVNRPPTQAEVIEATRLSSSQYYAFIHKGKSVSLETGLRLLSWLDELERSKLDEFDEEHDPRDPTPYRAEGSLEEGEVGGHKVVLQVREGKPPVVVGRPMEGAAP